MNGSTNRVNTLFVLPFDVKKVDDCLAKRKIRYHVGTLIQEVVLHVTECHVGSDDLICKWFGS